MIRTRTWLVPSLLLCSSLLLGCDPGQGVERGRSRYGNCAPCHGEGGGGNPELGAPPIAGLQSWYIEAQLRKFRDGQRGAHPMDEAGLRMRPMARTLQSEDDIKTVAAFVGAMPHPAPSAHVRTVTGNAARGAGLYKPCTACHGPRGNGMQSAGSPDLQHTGDWYLLAQLRKFKDGIRGAVPGDTTGAQMRAQVANLPDEQAMRDVVAYIMTLEP